MSTMQPLRGIWEKVDEGCAIYTGPSPDPEGERYPLGLCVYPTQIPFRSGEMQFKVKFSNIDPDNCARMLVGFNPDNRHYFSVGLGGYRRAYVSDVFDSSGWSAHRAEGSYDYLKKESIYDVRVSIDGQRVRLWVNGAHLLTDVFPSRLPGNQVGIMTWGKIRTEIFDITLTPRKPRVFVVMKFAEPFNGLYEKIIKPVCDSLEFDAFRSDDIFRPGIVLDDIVRGIIESDLVIAEITPANKNVFYELGYAHALRKETIHLAKRGTRLPFDIRHYRCIFYDKNIQAGTEALTKELRKNLENIKLATM